ncbi:sigma-70 family RNA polymerase sigma factor [bacterium]|nr:sigma-70 family RNA polymerase sigma factor [bacterium]
MATTGDRTDLAHICRLAAPTLSDGELLRRFTERRDEAAFETLVRRHAPMVLAAGRRVLGNAHEAEDVSQAAFLILAQKAAARRWGPSVAGWLHRVAHLLAVRARRTATRRARREGVAAAPVPTEPLAEITGRELLAVLDEELLPLPERFRAPLVLCYLQGATRDEAAGRLGCPLSTFKKRLATGRDRLHAALVRRGLGLPAALLVTTLVGRPTAAPAAFVKNTTQAALALAAGAAATGLVAPAVLELVHGGIGMTGWTKVRAALGLVLVGGLLAATAGAPGGNAGAQPEPAAPPAAPKKAPAEAVIRGLVKDPAGNPVAGAAVVAGVGDESGGRLTTTTGADGRFTFDRFPPGRNPEFATHVMAAKDGFAPAVGYSSPTYNTDLTLTLAEAGTYAGTVKDRAGRPVAGAEVQFGLVTRGGNYTGWGYTPADHIRGTGVGPFYLATTDATGAFRFATVPAGAELIFRARAPGYAEADTSAGGPRRDHVAGPGAKAVELTLDPEAVIRGRVTSRVPGVAVKDVAVRLTGSGNNHGVNRSAVPDAEGQFEFRGLRAGPFGVALGLPDGAAGVGTGASVTPKAGEPAVVALEVIEGVEVTGVVRVKGTTQPLPGASVTGSGTFDPLGRTRQAKTDEAGRFKLRLPPGEAKVYVVGMPAGFAHPSNQWDQRPVTVPAGGKGVAIAEPFEAVRVVDGLKGTVTDAAGRPLAHAKVSALQHTSVCGNFATEPVSASFDGTFNLPYSPNGPLEPGRSVPLRVTTDDGKTFEAAALVTKDGVSAVRVPTLPDVKGPDDVKAGELAGVVVDAKGRPLAGAKVHMFDWVDRPENFTVTGADGAFRLKAGHHRTVQVRFTKDGFAPVFVTHQPVGEKGLVIALDRATYFEGVVRGPDGRPAAGAVVRADSGPKVFEGGISPQVWTETTADTAGKYRLYVQPDEYAFHVKAKGAGVARLEKTGIGHGQARKLDVALRPGITFRAKVVDSVTGRPVAGLRLFDWQQNDVDGRTDTGGEVAIADLLPGEFRFQVESDGYARWWSEAATREWERKSVDDPKTGWQRNFDGLTFDLKPGMPAVTIVAEPAVKITGKVLDPDGQAVGGATVAPARTGSGNSLTGDTRFSVETKADGTFVMTLPASGAAEYNLVAHDGKYGQWRTWANGVLPPVKTTPGQAIENVTLTLTRPAVVRGKVVDAEGRPVAGREVRAHAADRLENRYYDPTTRTKADGTFELRFVRPGEQWVQVAPFWLSGADAPPGTSRTLTLRAGQVVENVGLVAADEGPR